MCEITVYLERDGQLEKLMDDAARIVVRHDGLELTRLFQTSQTVRAELREIDALNHTAILRLRDEGSAAPGWILKRRSIRTYTAVPISDAQLAALLQAAMAAPSANDARPWAFVCEPS